MEGIFYFLCFLLSSLNFSFIRISISIKSFRQIQGLYEKSLKMRTYQYQEHINESLENRTYLYLQYT